MSKNRTSVSYARNSLGLVWFLGDRQCFLILQGIAAVKLVGQKVLDGQRQQQKNHEPGEQFHGLAPMALQDFTKVRSLSHRQYGSSPQKLLDLIRGHTAQLRFLGRDIDTKTGGPISFRAYQR